LKLLHARPIGRRWIITGLRVNLLPNGGKLRKASSRVAGTLLFVVAPAGVDPELRGAVT